MIRPAVLVISIHAPTRGATCHGQINSVYLQISIHAPTRGATKCLTTYVNFILFQSTLLQEERLSDQLKAMDGLEFQSTLLQEERHPLLRSGKHPRIFQSTLLQEERHCFYNIMAYESYFNPRSYKRSDCNLCE